MKYLVQIRLRLGYMDIIEGKATKTQIHDKPDIKRGWIIRGASFLINLRLSGLRPRDVSLMTGHDHVVADR